MIVTLLAFSQSCFGQPNATYRTRRSAYQLAYGVKFTIDYSDEFKLALRISLSGGAGAFVGQNWLYPSVNSDFGIYHGGIGSSFRPSGGKWLDFETVIAYTFTAGFLNRMKIENDRRPGLRNYPLYYYSNRSFATLQNPYRYSFSWGGNAVIYYRRERYKAQHVGFANLHIGRVQASYTNDGPPFKPPFGDKFDRFNTGAAWLSFHGDDHWAINLVEIGYNKFTGFSPGSYEISNKLGNSYVFYKETEENFFNKSLVYLNVGNTARGWVATGNLYNYRHLDVQHTIHKMGYYPLHLVPYNGTWGGAGNIGYQKSLITLK